MAGAGVDQYTFHVEPVMDEIEPICRKIREAGMKVGLGIKPNTPVSVIEEYIGLADLILVMTVEPGFGGQKFMSDMMPKVEYLRKNYPQMDIEVDGGVSLETIGECARAGANMIVAGTAIIKAQDQQQVMREMKQTVTQAINSNNCPPMSGIDLILGLPQI